MAEAKLGDPGSSAVGAFGRDCTTEPGFSDLVLPGQLHLDEVLGEGKLRQRQEAILRVCQVRLVEAKVLVIVLGLVLPIY